VLYWKKITCLAMLSLGLTSCSSHLIGSPIDRAPVIARLDIISENPGNQTTVAVERILQAHDIQLDNQAPVVLHLSQMNYSHPLPDSINAGSAFSTTATLSATYRLTTASGKLIRPDTTVTASQNLFHNANQVNTSSMDIIFIQTLSKQLANTLYYQLSGTNTIQEIEKILGKAHAPKRR
jgi:outer membrane lipopolysaccharide assembly protein LptE/RlpB